MKPKLLTKRQQIGIFNTENPIELMREYVSFSKDIMEAASWKSFTNNVQRMLDSDKPVTEMQIQAFQNLSPADAQEITHKLQGHVYPATFEKMLDVFPPEVSKEILIQYGKDCRIADQVFIKALDVLQTDAREIFLAAKFWYCIDIDVFNKILRVFSKEGTKKFLIEMADADLNLSDEVELKILRIYPKEDLKELLHCFISKLSGLNTNWFLKIFEICDSKEEIKGILEHAIKNDMDLWYSTLEQIVEYFPKDEAKALLDAFFKTSPGVNEYDTEEKEALYLALR